MRKLDVFFYGFISGVVATLFVIAGICWYYETDTSTPVPDTHRHG